MEGSHEILLWDRPVGKADVRREGLYYRFSCRCDMAEDTLCRVTVGTENLGILVPVRGGFGLETKVPVKRFAGVTPEFRLIPNKPVVSGKFVPIKPEEPFAYIERLKNAYLATRNGQIGVVIKEEAGV